LEREDDAFFDAIAGAYDALAAAEPERFRVLDAGAEPAVVLAAARAALADLG
jgi:dTMP kinase